MAGTPALADRKSYDYLMSSLVERERLYVVARSQGATPVAAAQSAKYEDPVQAATDNEQNLSIRTAIEYALRLRARETKLTREDVIAGLMDALPMATSASEIVQAWREIGRIIGAYEPVKVQIDHTHHVTTEQLQRMDDMELAKLASIDAEFVVLEEDR